MRPETKVLVVDDEDVLRTFIGMILELHGFAVVLAPNVPEALQAIEAERFDVLLSDMGMPGPGDGLTVIRAMQEKHPKAVNFLMSGHVDPHAADMPLHADSILRKPFEMRDVVSMIRARLAVAE